MIGEKRGLVVLTLLSISCLLFFSSKSYAQEGGTITGKIVTSESAESLPGAFGRNLRIASRNWLECLQACGRQGDGDILKRLGSLFDSDD